MKQSLQVFTFYGIPLRLHWTFGLVFVFVFYRGKSENWSFHEILLEMGFVLSLFLCVALHEYGHALMARRFGVSTLDIILSPIGGVARLDRLPTKPLQELWIALAGPLVNVGIALLLGLYFFSIPSERRLQMLQALASQESSYLFSDMPEWGIWLLGLFVINIALALFNMLPAFPMDGGRILRALLSMWIGRLRATWFAARIGQGIAITFIAFNLWRLWESSGKEGLLSVFIGGFVFLLARNEYRFIAFEEALRRGTAGDLARQHFTPLYTTDAMDKAIQLFLAGEEKNFLVFDEWQNLVAVLPEHRTAHALQSADGRAPVSQYMLHELLPLSEKESLSVSLKRLQSSQGGALPVYNEWHALVGILDTPSMDRHMRNLHRRA